MLEKIILHLKNIVKLLLNRGSFLVFDFFSSYFLIKKNRIFIILTFITLICFVFYIEIFLFKLVILLSIGYLLFKKLEDIKFKNTLRSKLSLSSNSDKIEKHFFNDKNLIVFEISFLNYFSFYISEKYFRFAILKSKGFNLLNIFFDIQKKKIKLYFENTSLEQSEHLVFKIMNYIHECNFAKMQLKSFNENNSRIFCFEKLKYYNYRGLLFSLSRDEDIKKFNKNFALSKKIKTFTDVKRDLSNQLKKHNVLYSTAYLGYGLNIGKPWAVSHGIGRWVYRLQNVINPFIANKRVLDLGANTGVLPIIMLMSGAKEVVGVELDKLNCETSKVYKELAEWNLNKQLNFRMINKNMTEIVKWREEYFDVVTLYCSIYYLKEPEIQELLDWIKKYSKYIVVEANEISSVSGRKEIAKIQFIKNILIANEFKIIAEDQDKKSLRPFVIGAI